MSLFEDNSSLKTLINISIVVWLMIYAKKSDATHNINNQFKDLEQIKLASNRSTNIRVNELHDYTIVTASRLPNESPDFVRSSVLKKGSIIINEESNEVLQQPTIITNNTSVQSNFEKQTTRAKKRWSLKILGGSEEADHIAQELDCNNLGLVKGFLDTYLFEEKLTTFNGTNLARDKRDSTETTDQLLKTHKHVVWAQQLTQLIRVKRASINNPLNNYNLQQQRFAANNNHMQQLFPPPSNSPALNSPVQWVPYPQGPSLQAASINQASNNHANQLMLDPRLTSQHHHHQSMLTQQAPPINQYQHSVYSNVQQPIVNTERKFTSWFSPASATIPKLGPLSNYPEASLQPERVPQLMSPAGSSALANSDVDGNNKTTNKQQAMLDDDVFARGYSSSVTNEEKLKYNDELWIHQWYLLDNSNSAFVDNSVNLHVQEAWQLGFTGKNVVISIIDDGLEWNHTDLIKNYDPLASYDLNNDRADPFPRYDPMDKQNHGTRCAGEIAMTANNRKCGIGVAPDVKIGCIKILDGPLDENIEAKSLLHNRAYIDIYSASWGPEDNGIALEGPKMPQAQALSMGIEEGRKGLGSIYIWASGNGGKDGDNCNCDGYVSSLYTIAIGSASQKGHFPYYSERCASTMAVTCSSGGLTEKKITTTDLHNRCTTDFVGTSAAAPLAAGIMALVLEANPRITWRDAQHLIAWNSDYYPLRDNTGWFRNSAGLMFNNKFGFGLMNAKLLVESALKWQNVPAKSQCTVYTSANGEQQEGLVGETLPARIMTGAPDVVVRFTTDGCQQLEEKLQPAVNYLEHVQLITTIEYPVRGDLEIFLISPSGTTSNILTHRPRDKTALGFTDWPFMSVHFWGEQPQGVWTLRVRDKNRGQTKISAGYLVNATLILHGTTKKPAHMDRARLYEGEDLIQDTIEKSVVHVDPETGHKTHDENPWDQNTSLNDLSLVSNVESEDGLIKARMLKNVATTKRPLRKSGLHFIRI